MNVIVTGASSGFGAHISQILINKGYFVIGIARRAEKLNELKQKLGQNFYPIVSDIANLEEIKKQFPPNIQTIDVLINNAGLALGLEPAQQAQLSDWHTMINTNIFGLVDITHFVLPFMVKQQSGTVINIGSTAGTYAYTGANVYGATKAFVSQFSDNLRTDLAGTNVRVCNVEPGLCAETEFSQVRFKGDQQRASDVYKDVDALTGLDIANTLDWIIHLPQHVNINHIEIMPTAQCSAGLAVTKKHIK